MDELVTATLMCLIAYAGVFVVLAFLVLCIRCLKWADLYEDKKPGQRNGIVSTAREK